jgi:hypothetical protein
MKQPSEKKRTNLLGRDVKITTSGTTKTREVTGNKIAKTKVTAQASKGGKKITTSKIKMSPREGIVDVTNKTRYTGAAGRAKMTDMNPNTSKKKVTTRAFKVSPIEAAMLKNKDSVRQAAKKMYKGTNQPKRF